MQNERERWALADKNGTVFEYTLADKASQALRAYELQMGSETAARSLFRQGAQLVLVHTKHTLMANE